MKIIPCLQRSPEWFQVRLGRLTGSRAQDAFATTKSGPSTSRRNLRIQLVLERLTGQSQENGFQSFDMDRGLELEADAQGAYEVKTGILVEPVGFVAHDELMAGCSPDGLTVDGLIEIKCPKAATHLDYLRGGLPLEYRTQITHGLWLTGAQWGDFVSFHPAFPEPLRLKVTRLYSKDIDLKSYEVAVKSFLAEVDKEHAEVEAMVGAAA